jgi:hypothetical protein
LIDKLEILGEHSGLKLTQMLSTNVSERKKLYNARRGCGIAKSLGSERTYECEYLKGAVAD